MSERIANIILGSGQQASTGFGKQAARVAGLAAALAGAILLAGCGQKGPLYLPPAETPPAHHNLTPAAAPVPASAPASAPIRP